MYGLESILIDERINNIIAELSPNHDDNLISKYDMKETPIQFVIEDALMPSLLGDKKIIICDDAFFLSSSIYKTIFENDLEALLKYIKNANDNTYIIFKVKADSLDERKKIVKELKKNSTIFEAKKLETYDLVDKIYKKILDNGYNISKKNVQYLIGRGGHIYSNLENEIQKLFMYKLDSKEILEEDITNLVTKRIEENIFDLIENIVNKNYEKIFEIYYELLLNNEEIVKIIIMLANKYRLLYQTKILSAMGYSEKDMAAKLKVHPYPVKLAVQKGKTLTEEQLLNYLYDLSELDIKIKTGKIDKNIAMELFFLQV